MKWLLWFQVFFHILFWHHTMFVLLMKMYFVIKSYCTDSRKAVSLANTATDDEFYNCDSKYLEKNCFSALRTVRLLNEIHLHQCSLMNMRWLSRSLCCFFFSDEKTRPIEPTMRPTVDGLIAWWRDYLRLFLASFALIYWESWCSRKCDRQNDGLTDRCMTDGFTDQWT